MKVKKLLKVISPYTDVVIRDGYGKMTNLCAATNVQEIYLERKVVMVWIDNVITLNIGIEGTIDD